jgi:polysaccharide biosynthesis protein PslG
MVPRNPCFVQCLRIFGLFTVLAAAIGMSGCAGLSSASPSSSSPPSQQLPPDAIPSTYMGMQMNAGTISRQPWPSIPFGAQRLWDSGVSWKDINTADGAYDWSLLDRWLSEAHDHNVDLLYTFGETPAWASSNPNDSSCAAGAGACDPPNDLNTDGSGSDLHWKDFVGALIAHNQQSGTGHIQYWEIWNEALGNPLRWTGTIPQLVRMAKDASAIIKQADSSAIVLTPTFGPQLDTSRALLDSYFAAGGDQYADAVALHGYVTGRGSAGNPEDLVRDMSLSQPVLSKYGLQQKPVWDTEASWGDVLDNGFTDPDMQAAFLARFYLLHWSLGFARFYWYQWNNQVWGTLWTPDTSDPSAPGTLHAPGIAYQQISDWMVGASLTSACSAKGTVWTCQFARANGYQGLAVWDASQSCSHGACTTSNFTFPAGYTRYSDLSGNTNTLEGSTLAIGAKPLLLTNQ